MMNPQCKGRIALMLPRFSRYGGVEQFGYHLAEALAQRGYSVDFICARREDEPPPGVRVLPVGRPRGPRVLKMLCFAIGAERLRKKGGYDLTISLGKTWTQDIARVGGGPLQGFWRLSSEAWEPGLPRLGKQLRRILQPANWLTLLIERRMFTETPYVVGISDTVTSWTKEQYPLLGESGSGTQLLTIYNCPDLSRFHPASLEEREKARQDFGLDPERYALGVATTNFALKGVGPLIRALALLDDSYSLHIAGGRKPERYMRLAASLGVESRVHFHGKVTDMPAFYHALDMFVLPTFYDTLGNVVLEALASGLKTLCSDRAGASAFLPQERILRRPGDPAALAEAIRALRDASEPVAFTPKGGGLDEFIGLVEQVIVEKRRNEKGGM